MNGHTSTGNHGHSSGSLPAPSTVGDRTLSQPTQAPKSHPSYPVGLNGPGEDGRSMAAVGGTLPTDHTEQLRICLTEEVNLLTVLLTARLPQRAQGHGDHERLDGLLLLAGHTEQCLAGGPGPHPGGWGGAAGQVCPRVQITASSQVPLQAGPVGSSREGAEGIPLPSPAWPQRPLPQPHQSPVPDIRHFFVSHRRLQESRRFRPGKPPAATHQLSGFKLQGT